MSKRIQKIILTFSGLIIFAILAAGSADSGSSTSSSSSNGTSATSTSNEPMLEIQNWSWHDEYDYAIAEGLVKNISGTKLENVEAEVSFKTSDGTFITSSDALIQYNPIMPDQSSPFKVMATFNPAMKSASIQFKYLGGETIPWKEKGK